MIPRRWILALALFVAPAAASADDSAMIDGPRIRVGDVVAGVEGAIADVDLGPAPPPGGTRVVARAEVTRNLKKSGFDAKGLAIRDAVRVRSASIRIPPADLVAMATPAIEDALPDGVTLTSASARTAVVVSPKAIIGKAEVPKPPKREGTLRTTALVELLNDGEPVARVPVAIVVEVGPDAARADVTRGARITLTIEKRSASISMTGVALDDADVGEVAGFRVAQTGRVLRAQVTSSRTAKVVTP